MVGQTISHYKVIEKLGEGGMGVVYKAEDTKLDRLAALKFLPQHLTANESEKVRFLQEARAASALNHPNVCTIYGIEEHNGQQFIEMEYVDGVTLRKKCESSPLPLNDAMGYAIQIGEALHEAHSKGIVHRDIKCENIMVNSKNQIKVMDFGLAKMKGSMRLTKTSSTVGTLAYMSPEQIQGMKIDHRADLWSFGVVLYEMITGELPFKADHNAALMYMIINVEAPELQEKDERVIPGMLALVRGLLEKNRERRISSADEVVQRLRSVVRDSSRPAPKADDRRSIAVLPFANLSPDPDNEYFSAGITDEITGSLSRLKQLKVCSRSMALQYNGKLIDPRIVGRELTADVILEGSIRRIGNRIRMAAELTDTRTGFQLWAQSYDRQIEDVFAVQDEIARTIVDALELQLTSADRSDLLQKYKANVQAYEEYLRGRFMFNKRQNDAVKEAIVHFRRAIEIDLNYTLAYAGLAICYSSNYVSMDSTEALLLGNEALQKAIALEPDIDEVQVAWGLYLFVQCDLAKARAHYERTLQLNRSHVNAHHWLAYVYLASGDFTSALRENQEALRLEPLYLIINAYAAFIHFCMGNCQQALEALEKSLEIDDTFSPGHHIKAWVLTWMGRNDDAIQSADDAAKGWGDHQLLSVVRAVIAARRGNNSDALAQLNHLRDKERSGTYVHPFDYASIHAALGNRDEMFAALELASDVRFYWWFVLLKVHPLFTPYHSEDRFQAVLNKLGLRQ